MRGQMRKMRSWDKLSHYDEADLDPRKRAMNRRAQSVYRPKSFDPQTSTDFDGQHDSSFSDFRATVANDDNQEATKISSVFSRKAGKKLLERARTFHRGKYNSVFNKDNRQSKTTSANNLAASEMETKSVFGKVTSTVAPSVFGKVGSKHSGASPNVFGASSVFSTTSEENFPQKEKSSNVTFGTNMKRIWNDDSDVRNPVSDSAPFKKFAGSSKEPEIQTRINSVLVESLPLTSKIDKLKARDDNIRKILNADQVRSEILVGTLDQMCPELEMYVRQSTNRVDDYELNGSGEPDAMKFVKEYTRSSADKENPLPHEVRSIKGLALSMDYLMDTVINSYDSDKLNSSFSPGNWFNFLWNRTRSIRNDMTIQNMHTIESVELIEKVTRFHIFCGYALSDCDYHEFDPKVNTEHYSKSMQTLKHIYYDLSRKGLQCANEAEFRCYELLKNLNNPTSAMVEAAKYAPRVLNDPKFQLALKMHRAFTQGNLVRFLRLYKNEASFLMSCILHPLLTETRISVLKCLSSSCGAARNTYTVDEIQQLLSFASAEQVIKFCEPFGFKDGVNASIVEVRKLTSEEELLVSEMGNVKDVSLVDSKQDKSLGEVINGNSPIDTKYKQQLQDLSNFEDIQFSGTESGPTIIADQSSLENDDDNNQDSSFEEIDNDYKDGGNEDYTHSVIDSKLREQKLFSELAEMLYEELVIEIAQDQSRQAILELIEKARRLKETVALICFELENEIVSELSNFTAEEVINECRSSLITNSADICEDILTQVVGELCAKTAREAILSEKEQQLARFVSELVFADMKKEVISELCVEIARESYQESKEKEDNIKTMKKYYNIWKQKISRAKEHKFYRESFPPRIGSGKLDIKQVCPKNFEIREKLTYISKLNEAQQCLNEVAANEISKPFTSHELLGNLVSKFVHVAILNVSPNSEFSKWFLSKFSGQKSDLVNSHKSVIRCEKSALLSYLCVSCAEIGTAQNYLENFAPNLVIILDPNRCLEEWWVNETCLNNKESFLSFYVCASENEGVLLEKNGFDIDNYCFDSSSLSSFHRSSEHFMEMMRVLIENSSKIYEMPHKVSLQQFIVSCLREWFSLFVSPNYLTGLKESFKRAMIVEWLLELYDSLVVQLDQFITENKTEFPLRIFATQVKELKSGLIAEIFSKLRIFPGDILSAIGNCNSWIECLDILEKLIQSLYPSELCQILGRKFEAVLVGEYGEKNDSETVIVTPHQNFPWTLLFLELIMFNAELVCGEIEDSTVFLSCAESDFVFERPECWNLYLKAVLNSTKVHSYTVNGAVVLVK